MLWVDFHEFEKWVDYGPEKFIKSWTDQEHILDTVSLSVSPFYDCRTSHRTGSLCMSAAVLVQRSVLIYFTYVLAGNGTMPI